MLKIEYTGQFKRDLKKITKRQKKLDKLQLIMEFIAHKKKLPINLKDHALSGNWSHHRELHIEPDWLLIYKYIPKKSVIIFVRTGSHSDLFG